MIQSIYGGLLKWWYPTTMGFPTKNDHLVVFWGYHHLKKHPYIKVIQSDGWLHKSSASGQVAAFFQNNSHRHRWSIPRAGHRKSILAFSTAKHPTNETLEKRRKNQLKPNWCQSNWWPQKTLNATTLFEVCFNIHYKVTCMERVHYQRLTCIKNKFEAENFIKFPEKRDVS